MDMQFCIINLHVYPSVKYLCHAQARKLGILPESGTQNAATAPGGGAGEWTGKRKGDLRTKLDSKPRQLIVVDAKDKDALTAYFDVRTTTQSFLPSISYFPPLCLFIFLL